MYYSGAKIIKDLNRCLCSTDKKRAGYPKPHWTTEIKENTDINIKEYLVLVSIEQKCQCSAEAKSKRGFRGY